MRKCIRLFQKMIYDARSRIQKAIYNTIYQLMAVKKTHPEYLEKADAMLMIPDYFHFKLSGKKVQEYSEATTSQLINPVTKDWDYELIDMLGFPRGIFQKVLMPGTTIGNLTDEVRELVGYDCKVVLPPYPRYGICSYGNSYQCGRYLLYQFGNMVINGRGNGGSELLTKE